MPPKGRAARHPKEAYSVALICAQPVEALALICMLDEQHQYLPQAPVDQNSYTLGAIASHNVVVVCARNGAMYGIRRAVSDMLHTFPYLQLALSIGIGGGAPCSSHDVRLGDVVLGIGTGSQAPIVDFDFGVSQSGRLDPLISHSDSPQPLLSAVARLRSRHMTEVPAMHRYLAELHSKAASLMGEKLASHDPVSQFILDEKYSATLFARPLQPADQLFKPEYEHVSGNSDCSSCDMNYLVQRPSRPSLGPCLHFGPIASTNTVLKSGKERERLREKYEVLCFEKEAAGLKSPIPSLFIRGICDYADSHHSDAWQAYACATAAACAKEMLSIISPTTISDLRTIRFESGETNRHIDQSSSRIIFGVPERRNETFIGRRELLQQIEKVLLRYHCVVLWGAGGMGKTEVAIEFAHRQSLTSVEHQIFWLDGSSAQALAHSCMALSTRLAHIEVGPSKTGPGYLQALDAQLFEQQSKWFLIVDNLDEQDSESIEEIWLRSIIQKIVYSSKSEWMILITTRRPLEIKGISDHSKIELLPLTQAEAVEILQKNKTSDTSDLNAADELDSSAQPILQQIVNKLGGLPLVISLAAAFMRESGTSPRDYLAILNKTTLSMTDDSSSSLDNFALTSSLVLNIVETNQPSAFETLCIAVMFNRLEIPAQLLQVDENGAHRAQADVHCLLDYELISQGSGGQTFFVHPEIRAEVQRHLQKAGRETLYTNKTAQVLTFVLSAMTQENESVINDLMTIAYDLLPNSLDGVSSPLITARLRLKVGEIDLGRGRVAEALINILAAFFVFDRELDERDVEVLAARELSAELLSRLDQHDEAEQHLREILRIKDELFGSTHQETLQTKSRLAKQCQLAHKMTEAKELFQEVLNSKYSTLGSYHPDTITAMNDLAAVLTEKAMYTQDTRDYATAQELYTRIIASCQLVMGSEHPDTLTSLNNLVFLQAQQQNYAEAEQTAYRALNMSEEALGLKHQNTLTSMNNLAHIWLKMGKLDQAQQLTERALGISSRSMDDNDASKSTMLVNLAQIYYEQGNIGAAESTYRAALESLERAFGGDDGRTLNCQSSLASILEEKGDLEGAAALLEKIWQGYGRLLGPEDELTKEWLEHLQGVRAQLRGDQPQTKHKREEVAATSEKLASLDIEQTSPGSRPDDVIIAVLGETGSGKSTFISLFVDEDLPIGRSLAPQTQGIQMFRCSLPDMSNLVLVDTPGFNDTFRSDVDVFKELADWLVQVYVKQQKLIGIIYLHRVSDVRLGGSAVRSLRVFNKLCGEGSLECVALATTFWQHVDPKVGAEREKELCETPEFWSDLIARGSKVFRHDHEETSGKAIINHLVKQNQIAVVRVQKELIIEGKELYETEAGMEVEAELQRVKERYERQILDLRDELKEALESNDKWWTQEIMQLRAEIEAKLRENEESRRSLRRSP